MALVILYLQEKLIEWSIKLYTLLLTFFKIQKTSLFTFFCFVAYVFLNYGLRDDIPFMAALIGVEYGRVKQLLQCRLLQLFDVVHLYHQCLVSL